LKAGQSKPGFGKTGADPNPVGTYPAELVTFYESGNSKRFFPLNGKISAFGARRTRKNLTKSFIFSFPAALYAG
jgi:hypothetical protein